MMWKRLRRSIKILLLAAFAVLLAYQLWIAAWLAWWEGHNHESSAYMDARLSDLREKDPRAYAGRRNSALTYMRREWRNAAIRSRAPHRRRRAAPRPSWPTPARCTHR